MSCPSDNYRRGEPGCKSEPGACSGQWAPLVARHGGRRTMNPFGIMMEMHNQHTEKTDWTAFILGSIAAFIR